MIIKSNIRGGYRAAADYLKAVGENEKIRLVEISDPDARNLDEAFQNMWSLASNTKCTKPLHHISINPFKDERLTDEQVLKIVERCEQKYGYKPGEHQRVIVEHIKDGRQHFHVIWNRVNMDTGRVVWPGHHWKKSKQAAREMEKELGLKRPMPRRMTRSSRVRRHLRDKSHQRQNSKERNTGAALCRKDVQGRKSILARWTLPDDKTVPAYPPQSAADTAHHLRHADQTGGNFAAVLAAYLGISAQATPEAARKRASQDADANAPPRHDPRRTYRMGMGKRTLGHPRHARDLCGF